MREVRSGAIAPRAWISCGLAYAAFSSHVSPTLPASLGCDGGRSSFALVSALERSKHACGRNLTAWVSAHRIAWRPNPAAARMLDPISMTGQAVAQ